MIIEGATRQLGIRSGQTPVIAAPDSVPKTEHTQQSCLSPVKCENPRLPQLVYQELRIARLIDENAPSGLLVLPIRKFVAALNRLPQETGLVDQYFAYSVIVNGLQCVVIRDDIHTELDRSAATVLRLPESEVRFMQLFAKTNEQAVSRMNAWRSPHSSPDEIRLISPESIIKKAQEVTRMNPNISLYRLTKDQVKKRSFGTVDGGLPGALMGLATPNYASYFFVEEYADQSVSVVGPIYEIEKDGQQTYKTPELLTVFHGRNRTIALQMLRQLVSGSKLSEQELECVRESVLP